MEYLLVANLLIWLIVGLVKIEFRYEEWVERKKECDHAFTKWGDPITGNGEMTQLRACKKCNLFEVQSLWSSEWEPTSTEENQ